MARGINVPGYRISGVNTQTGSGATTGRGKKKKPVAQPKTAIDRFKQMLTDKQAASTPTKTPSAGAAPRSSGVSGSWGGTATPGSSGVSGSWGGTATPGDSSISEASEKEKLAMEWEKARFKTPFADLAAGAQSVFGAGELAGRDPETMTGVQTVGVVGVSVAGLAAMYAVAGAANAWFQIGTLGSTQRTLAGGAAAGIAINTATNRIAQQGLGKIWGLGLVTALGAWFGPIFLGMWGRAEAPEPPVILENKLIPQAKKTGNWELVDQGIAIADEAYDYKKWEEAGMKTPAGAIIGSKKKFDAGKQSLEVLKQYVEIEKELLRTGGTEADRRLLAAKAQQDMYDASVVKNALIQREAFDYEQAAYAASRSLQRDQDKQAMVDQAMFWAEQRDLERKKEADDRQAIADFWFEYRKLLLKLSNENRPSNLKFGLL